MQRGREHPLTDNHAKKKKMNPSIYIIYFGIYVNSDLNMINEVCI